ncbi:MAG: CopG family ribbon-helix-helix protein [Sulfolobales archaeon]
MVKIGVSIPSGLYQEFMKIIKERGFRNRSAGVQEAIRIFVSQYKESYDKNASAIGIIAIYYNHEIHEIDEKLIDLQHEYLDIVISMQHIHVSKNYCVQIIAVKGVIKKIEDLLRDLSSLRISYLKYIILPLLET